MTPEAAESPARSLRGALALTAFALLTAEVVLVRVFDAILITNSGYVVVTFAMFALSLSGVYVALRPPLATDRIAARLQVASALAAIAMLAIQPVLNSVPMLTDPLPGALRYAVAAALIVGVLIIPFLVGGVVFTYVFSTYPRSIGALYAWDLGGAAIGCIAFVPLLRPIGPGGILVGVAGILFAASALFDRSNRTRRITGGLAAAACVAIASFAPASALDFRLLKDKREVRTAQEANRIEFTEWDPISRIDVVAYGATKTFPALKHVAYDGGSQSSHFFPFDGNFAALRELLETASGPAGHHFWTRAVAAAHYLKRDTDARVVIFGSAAGQETKAALTFNAAHVTGIDMVGTVVRLGKTTYAPWIGNLFNDPRVENRVGEGRSFLRSSNETFDILQIFSNHTSSNAGIGNGAGAPVYLQTVEAYEEYITHLAPNGVLQINHHFYPRMLATAATAWAHVVGTEFWRHVVLYDVGGWDPLPTLLIKRSPWTAGEIADLDKFFALEERHGEKFNRILDPIGGTHGEPLQSLLSGPPDPALLAAVPFQLRPATDDWPFFNNIQRGLAPVAVDSTRLINDYLASAINGRLSLPLGEYALPVGVGLCGILLALVLVAVPLRRWGRVAAPWTAKGWALGYFACLGSGYIIVELVLIQLFQKNVGYPLYTLSTVIFTMLAASALGSLVSGPLRVTAEGRWYLPFVATVLVGAALLLGLPSIGRATLTLALPERVALTSAVIAPLAFFMGMAMPLGVRALVNQPAGSIAWAWGANALFTVIGGIATGLLGLLVGFRASLLLAIGIYVVASLLYLPVRRAAQSHTSAAP